MLRSDLHPEDDGEPAEIVHWQPVHGHPRPRVLDERGVLLVVTVAVFGGIVLGALVGRLRAGRP
jgi:hypothetical protein